MLRHMVWKMMISKMSCKSFLIKMNQTICLNEDKMLEFRTLLGHSTREEVQVQYGINSKETPKCLWTISQMTGTSSSSTKTNQ